MNWLLSYSSGEIGEEVEEVDGRGRRLGEV